MLRRLRARGAASHLVLEETEGRIRAACGLSLHAAWCMPATHGQPSCASCVAAFRRVIRDTHPPPHVGGDSAGVVIPLASRRVKPEEELG